MSCSLTQQQSRKLLTGGAIALKRSECGSGEQMIHLTSQQHNRLSKGNGMRLRFSGVQIAHNKKHGRGLGDWAKSKAKTIARAGVDAGADYLKTVAGNAAQAALGGIPLVGKKLGKLASKGVEKGVDMAAEAVKNKVIGRGMKKSRKRKGEGLFSSVGNVLDTGVNRVLGTGLYNPGYGAGILPKPIRGVNSNAAGI